MAPARYAPLPNPRSVPDAEREMDDAFAADDDDFSDHNETTPLNINHAHDDHSDAPPQTPHTGAYDFERDYDMPPPGSPPGPSSVAIPNNIGNSNGLLPTSPVVHAAPRPSFFRRAVGALLPSHYQRVPAAPARPRGGGIENDGVFANVMAKPGRQVQVTAANGDVYMVPEETQSEAPPSYAAAQLDAAPAYWETTVHAPIPSDLSGDMIIDELPTGTVFTFFFTALISWFFQLPGFLITYLCHSTHAGKFGSQLGLALTLIQFGFSASMSDSIEVPILPVDSGVHDHEGMGMDWQDSINQTMSAIMSTATADVPTPTSSLVDWPSASAMPTEDLNPYSDMQAPATFGRQWMSFLLMTIGWFLLLTSIIGYVRVKRYELSIRASSTRSVTPDDTERDVALRRNLTEIFAMPLTEEDGQNEQAPPMQPIGSGRPLVHLDEEAARGLIMEARLEHDLRAAGLL
ncbi:hypothetical protein DENSPDRAFT_877451 [Dentipellis sp. KUC8613]|nr:hypothetical protein DENSPDRAFT_877451 [Dentipellis sp. KUC8613]